VGVPGVLRTQVHAAMHLPTRRQKLPRFLARVLAPAAEGGVPTDDDAAAAALLRAVATEEGLQADVLMAAVDAVDVAAMRTTQRRLVEAWMGVAPGNSTLVTNGRLLDSPATASPLLKVHPLSAEELCTHPTTANNNGWTDSATIDTRRRQHVWILCRANLRSVHRIDIITFHPTRGCWAALTALRL
jgi:hypothetical protein